MSKLSVLLERRNAYATVHARQSSNVSRWIMSSTGITPGMLVDSFGLTNGTGNEMLRDCITLLAEGLPQLCQDLSNGCDCPTSDKHDLSMKQFIATTRLCWQIAG